MNWVLILACTAQESDEKEVSSSTDIAILTTVASDYSVGALASIDLETLQPIEEIAAVSGDPNAIYDGGYIWQLNRYMYDTIRKYAPSNLGVPLLEVSIAPASGSANPHDVANCGEYLFVSQYDRGSLLVMDPEDLSLITEIDLSNYAADGIPEASSLVVEDDRLFVGLQNLERTGAVWTPIGSVVVEISCLNLSIEQDWSFGLNVRLYDWPDHSGFLLSSNAGENTASGIYHFQADVGATLLTSSSFGNVTDLTVQDDQITYISLTEDNSGYQVSCYDISSEETISLAAREEYLAGIGSTIAGEAWVLSSFGWVNPAADFIGINVLDMESCTEQRSIPLNLGPSSITFIEDVQ